MNCIFGIDLGGTEIKIGKFCDGRLIKKYSIKTDTSSCGKNILNDIKKEIDKEIGNDNLIGIGIDIPGPVVKGKVLGAQNIGWEEVDVSAYFLSKYNNIKVAVLNDANAATFGEMGFGGAKGYKNLVMITLGTGVGGGVVIDGKLVEGTTGSSGEVGHIRVERKNGRKCTCGLYGCLEQYTSATGIVKTAIEMRKGRETLLNKDNLTCKEVFDFAKANDKVALEVVEDMTEYLASGCATIVDVLNPEIIVIGGGVSKAGEFLLNKVENKFKELCFYSTRSTKFALAILGNDAGIYGAMYSVLGTSDEN